MRFLSLRPAVRLQIWSRLVCSRGPDFTLRSQGHAKWLLGTGVRLPKIPARHHVAWSINDTEKATQHENNDSLPECLSGLDEALASASKTVKQHPAMIQEEQDTILATLQWCSNNRVLFAKKMVEINFLSRLKKAISAEDPCVELLEILDSTVQHLLHVKRLQQYPHVPPALFQMGATSQRFHEMCQAQHLRANIQTKTVPMHSYGSHVGCVLHIQVPGMVDEWTFGRGLKKKNALRKAWIAMLVRLDATGTLRKVLSPFTEIPIEEIESIEEEKCNSEQGNDISCVYDYAARFGLVPHVEMREVMRQLRASPGRLRTIIEVSIKLPEHNIEVIAYGTTAQRAELVALAEFRRVTNEQHLQSGHAPQLDETFQNLNASTAVKFIDLVRYRKGWTSVQIESDIFRLAGLNYNLSQLLLDGVPFGQRAIAMDRKSSTKLAYLTAAIELARREPDILSLFAADQSEGNSSNSTGVRSYPAITADLKPKTLEIMRRTLHQAVQAGLSDGRRRLKATPGYMSKSEQRSSSQQEKDVISENLLHRLQQFEADPDTIQIREATSKLPMSLYSDRVLEIVSGNICSIIVGATGSGKTTQVPQIILDDAIRRSQGGDCNIVCSQPRRIATTSVARRVAAVRGEQLGQSVGYQVRGDSQLPRLGGSITYCTTGLLLQRLKWNADDVLDNATHLVIDEVHERDIEVDYLLIVLKKAITVRRLAGKPTPKIVLMSATMDTKLFADYFKTEVDGVSTPCPVLNVPGRSFPVKEMYLGEILEKITDNHAKGLKSLAARDKNDTYRYLMLETAFDGTGPDAVSVDWKRGGGPSKPNSGREEETLVPVTLLVATIAHICRTTPDGAILAFLPGLQDIQQAEELLKQDLIFGVNFADEKGFRIQLLHSTTPADQQRQIFERLPIGCRRIILSTNIAETSVTVPDVKHVVDLGKLRQNTYIHDGRISALQTVWQSGSNARQRAGRAGRVADGNYYGLYSRKRREGMPVSGLPELLRTDLQEVCLSVKAQGSVESVSDFLSAAIEPPPPEAVHSAVESLKAIGAFTEDEKLTALGSLLARLPIHPGLGKMILLGLIFRCLDPMIIIASMSGERPLFVRPLENKNLARAMKEHFNPADSDHLASMRAFQDLRQHAHDHGYSSLALRARRRYLHLGAFREITQTTKQVRKILARAGLLDADDVQDAESLEIGGKALNANADNLDLIKCLILAGVYPNVAFKKTEKEGISFRTASHELVVMHNSSVNAFKRSEMFPAHSPISIFTTLTKGIHGSDVLFMRDSSLITPLAAMLFGGRLEVNRKDGEIIMDGWLPFKFDDSNPRHMMNTISTFRDATDSMLNDVFNLLSNPDEIAEVVDAMVILTNGIVQVLDTEAQGRGTGPSEGKRMPTVTGDVPRDVAWADIGDVYKSGSLEQMEDL